MLTMDDYTHHPQFDLSQITEFVFLRTNLCCLTRSHIQILLDLGVTAEIDLERERQDTAPDKVYVHCQYGHGHSPTLVAAFLISQGKTVTEAVDTIKAARPEIHLEDVQLKALEKHYEKINE